MTALLSPPGAGLHFRPAAAPFAPVAADLLAADQILADAFAKYGPPLKPVVDQLAGYRGKRLRPAILLLAAKASGRVTAAHRTLAAAVEMIHTATLVHDDVLDGADRRRHAKTVNAVHGNQTAILLGDMLFSHAFHLTAAVDARACRVIGETTNRVCAGELRQVVERGNLHLTEADYFTVIDGKTAALTECCGRLAGMFADASEMLTDRLAAYGRNLGLAFQVADDLLDLSGTEAETGKTLGTDLGQLKLTLPLIHCLNTLPPTDADRLRTTLKAGGDVKPFLDRTQSLGYAKRKADDFVRKAKQALEMLPPSDAKAGLETLAEWSVRRPA